MSKLKEILNLLPENILNSLSKILDHHFEKVEEIRIRIGRPIECLTNSRILFTNDLTTLEDSERLLSKITQFSFYMLDEQLKRGYITIAGGHRIGLAGRVVLENGEVRGLRDISSYNIRVAREKIGIANPLTPYLFDRKWLSTLIVGPPQSGKTTLIRDLARLISTGIENRIIPAKKVGIVDERSEIAGCVNGIPQMSFGKRIDVLDGCPKAEGMMMLIRSMSPEVIFTDEIGRTEDIRAISEAIHAGVNLVTTAHGENLQDIIKRPIMRSIIEESGFDRIIELRRGKTVGEVVRILDKNQKNIFIQQRNFND